MVLLNVNFEKTIGKRMQARSDQAISLNETPSEFIVDLWDHFHERCRAGKRRTT